LEWALKRPAAAKAQPNVLGGRGTGAGCGRSLPKFPHKAVDLLALMCSFT
jgi:hypothetical protein